jgi:hypothetical protein
MYEYENLRRKGYELGDGEGTMYFIPVCPNCNRFVKMDSSIMVNGLGELKDVPNATCKKCGRVKLEQECID